MSLPIFCRSSSETLESEEKYGLYDKREFERLDEKKVYYLCR
jgi:hypothetical protein